MKKKYLDWFYVIMCLAMLGFVTYLFTSLMWEYINLPQSILTE